MYKTALLLVAFTVCITAGCKKSGVNKSPSPVNQDTAKPIGEVEFNAINAWALSAKSILKTSDNNFLVLGYKMLQGNNPWLDPYPVFLKINGDLQVKLSKIPLTNDAETIDQAIETSDAFYLLGQIQGDVTQTHFNNLLIIKTDKSGSVLWEKQYNDITWVYSLVKTSDNNLAVLAYNSESWLPYYGNENAFTVMMKMDMNGNVLFRKDYVQENLNYGCSDLVETNNGYAFIAYKRTLDSTTSLGSLVAQFCRTDNTGNIISKTQLDGDDVLYMRATHLIKKSDGGFIVSHFHSQVGGTNGGSTNNFNTYLYYLDADGNIVHYGNLFYGNSINQMWDVVGIKQSEEGDIYVLGVVILSASEWGIIMKRFNAEGVLTKEKLYYLDRYASALEETSDGNFIIVSNDGNNQGISLLKVNKELEIQ